MKKVSVLWVDDDFDGDSNLSWSLSQLKVGLESELRARDIAVEVRTSRSGAILDDIVLGKFDLLVLDVELKRTGSESREPASGFEVLERLGKVAIAVPPVALLTRHIPESGASSAQSFASGFTKHRKRFLRAFAKDSAGIKALAQFMEEVLARPGFTMVVMSDLHSGHISTQEKGNSYEVSLADEVARLGRSTRVDYLSVTGDFAWKQQANDLPHAATFVNRLRTALGTTAESQFLFCPGNHDVDLSAVEAPWAGFHSFVSQMGASDPGLMKRFYAFQERAGMLGPFVDRRSTLAVSRGNQDSVLFAALNSCKFVRGKKGNFVDPEVGDEQWTALRRLLSGEPDGQLRVALLHHPIFAAPGGDWPDERPLHDQAQALHQLASMGFRLVIHGHTHFSALYEHRVAVLNDAREGPPLSRLLVVACPTTGAEPSASTPHRQYVIVNVGHFDKERQTRTVSVRTRVYSHVDHSWSDGSSFAGEDFSL